MHRRRFLHAATLASAALPLAGPRALAQSTPSAATDGSLAGRVAAVDPEALLEALLVTPVTTPLLPRDTTPVEPAPWDDSSDADLVGTVGGVLFQAEGRASDTPLVIATAIVHPSAESAAAFLTEVGPGETQQLLGMPWFVEAFDDYAVSVAQVGFLLLAGGAEAPTDRDGTPGATPAPAASERAPRLDLRAVSYMTALLDHLEDVLATLDA